MPFDYDPGRWARPATRASLAPTAGRAPIRASQKIIDVALRAAGLSHVGLMRGDENPLVLLKGNFHPLGATRMHPAAGRLNR